MQRDPALAFRRTAPFLRFLTSFPIAFFPGALLTDLAYWKTANMMWANFSAWLLAIGGIMAALAALVGIVLLIASRAARAHRPLWPLFIGGLAVLVLALFDNLVHSRDEWTSVVPVGIILSAASVVVTLITLWLASTRRPTVIPVDYVGARP